MTNEYVFTSRYGEGAGPDPKTCCPDQCEGLGYVPIHVDETEEPWATLLQQALAEVANGKRVYEPDGYYFLKCPACGGTGKVVD